MKMYKGKLVVEAAKDQVSIMEGAGWSRTKPEPEVVEETVVEETKAEETEEETLAETATKTIPRRKPIKKV